MFLAPTQVAHEIVSHTPKVGMITSLGHQDLSPKEVFEEPRLTPLDLSVVRTIWASALHESKVALDAFSLVTS